jgi:hypothetical protein
MRGIGADSGMGGRRRGNDDHIDLVMIGSVTW